MKVVAIKTDGNEEIGTKNVLDFRFYNDVGDHFDVDIVDGALTIRTEYAIKISPEASNAIRVHSVRR